MYCTNFIFIANDNSLMVFSLEEGLWGRQSSRNRGTRRSKGNSFIRDRRVQEEKRTFCLSLDPGHKTNKTKTIRLLDFSVNESVFKLFIWESKSRNNIHNISSIKQQIYLSSETTEYKLSDPTGLIMKVEFEINIPC